MLKKTSMVLDGDRHLPKERIRHNLLVPAIATIPMNALIQNCWQQVMNHPE